MDSRLRGNDGLCDFLRDHQDLREKRKQAMGKRLWAIGKEVDARQGISGMTEGRGCPTGDLGHDRRVWMPDRDTRARVT